MRFCETIMQLVVIALCNDSSRYSVEAGISGELFHPMGCITESRVVYINDVDNGNYMMLEQFTCNAKLGINDVLEQLRSRGYFDAVARAKIGLNDTVSKVSYQSLEDALKETNVNLESHPMWKEFYELNKEKDHQILSYTAHRDESGAVLVIKDESGAFVLARLVEVY